jgi:hypothetical protein
MSTQNIYGGVLDATTITANKNTMPTFNQFASSQNVSGLAGSTTQFSGQKPKELGLKKLNGALGSNVGQGIMGAAGGLMNAIPIKTQADKGKNPTGYETQQAIGDALTKVPIPIVQAAGLAYKGISKLAEATGGNTNTITKDQAEDIGLNKGTRLLNNIVGTLHPGAG